MADDIVVWSLQKKVVGPVWSLIFDTLHFWEGGIRCYQCFSLKCFALKISIKYVHRVWVHIVVADAVILFYAKRHCVLRSIVVRTFISLFRNWKVYAWWNNPEKYCKKKFLYLEFENRSNAHIKILNFFPHKKFQTCGISHLIQENT